MNKKRPLHGKKTEKSDNFLGRMSIKTIVLSVVALIQMMLLITGTTFSWVETISSLALTGGGIIDNPVKTVANIGSGYNKPIDLDGYFKKAGNVHLSTCSSADGQNFYFPIVGDNNNYRQSTVNDRNVNYISYNLKVVNKEKNKSEDFKFGNIPSIKIGDKAVTDNRVRIAITVDGATKIFSNKDDTENVVAATDGKLSKTTVNSFDKYTNSDKDVTLPVFSIPANSSKEVKIALWLQESTGSNNDNNGDVAVNDFTLVVSKKRVEVKYGTDSDSTMGDISIGSNNQQFYYGEEGTTVPLNDTAKPGYKFMGWYKDIDCTIKAPVTDGKFKIGSDSNITLYALFKKTYTVNVIAVTDNVQGGEGGTVKINSDTASDKVSKSDVTVGETVELTATPKEGYKFVGWYDSATENTPPITGENPANVEIDSVNPTDRTIYARFDIIKYIVSASAVSEDDADNTKGNKITCGNEQKAQVTVTVKHGGSVTFKAVPADGSGYVFDGWYSDKACSSANKLSDNTTYTVSSVKADQNIYAKFVLKTFNVEAYAYCYNDETSDLSEQGDYGNVKSGTVTSTHIQQIIKYGQPFSFTAVENENCVFEGWYNKANNTLINDTSVTYSVDSFKGDSQTSNNKKSFYAKFKIKTKKITVHPVKNDTTDTSTVNINHTLTADTINYGETATISAEPGANSEFRGWFTDEACTEKVGDNYLDLNLSVTVNNDTPTNYYAKFEKKTTVTVYFKNVPGWTPPYAYVWYDKTHNESIEMTKVSDNYYKVDIDVKYTKIIFKNKDDWTGQTNGSDIPKIGNEKNCFIYDTTNTKYKGYWTKYVEETPAEKYTIYLTNNMGWDKVYCYAWNATKTTGKFPGVEMTDTNYRNDQGHAVYKVEVDSTYTGLVFSNGTNKNQTVNITDFKDGTAYYLKKDKDTKQHYYVDTWTYTPSN